MEIDQILTTVKRHANAAAIVAGLFLLAIGLLNGGFLGYTVAADKAGVAIYAGMGLVIIGSVGMSFRAWLDMRAESDRQKTSAWLKSETGDPDITVVGRRNE